MSFRLKVVSASQIVFDANVDKINITTTGGELTILPHHLPLISTLKEGGRLNIHQSKKVISYVVGKGILSVKEDETTILVDDIDLNEKSWN